MRVSGGWGATFPSSEARTPDARKSDFRAEWRSLIGDPALALVGGYRTKKREKFLFFSPPPPRFIRPAPIGDAGW